MRTVKNLLDEALKIKQNFDRFDDDDIDEDIFKKGGIGTVQIMIDANKYAAAELLPLLVELKALGRMGCSRSVRIEDWDGVNGFGFDGDGPSKIGAIVVRDLEEEE